MLGNKKTAKLNRNKNKMVICLNCGYSIGSFEEFWVYEDKNKDIYTFCCEECYDKGIKEIPLKLRKK